MAEKNFTVLEVGRQYLNGANSTRKIVHHDPDSTYQFTDEEGDSYMDNGRFREADESICDLVELLPLPPENIVPEDNGVHTDVPPDPEPPKYDAPVDTERSRPPEQIAPPPTNNPMVQISLTAAVNILFHLGRVPFGSDGYPVKDVSEAVDEIEADIRGRMT